MRALLFACCLPWLCFAQSGISLTGTVLDEDGAGVEYATVSLLQASDSSLLVGGVAGAGGIWQLQTTSVGESVLLRASFLGYEATYSPVFTVERRSSAVALHLRTAAQVLAEVEVTGRKLTDLHRVDKQVFDAAQFSNARGGTATDVLRNLPAVSVAADGTISVRGTDGFQLVIDGKPTQGDPLTILAQLPANAIESVEFITSPSAKYDPDGKGGILNIKTRRGSLNGWAVTANANLGLPSVQPYGNAERPHRYGADVTAGYRGSDWEYTLGLDYRRDDLDGQRIGYVNTYRNGILTEFPSAGERSFERENYSARLAVTHDLSPNQRLNAGFYAGKRTQYRTADILYTNQRRTRVATENFPGPEAYYDRYLATGDVLQSGEILSNATFYNENLRVRRGDFYIASLDYKLALPDKSVLALSGLYERTVLGGPSDNRILSWPDLRDTIQLQYNDNDNPLDGIRLQADYERQLGELKWESGYQYRYLKHPGDFVYLDKDFETGEFVVNPEFTNGILLRRDIHSVYSQVSGAGDRLQYSAGLRLEYFDRRVGLDRPDATYRLDRLNLFPSANLKYQLREGLALKAGYSRRIERTTTFKMTPFPEREHNETLEQGDAELLPELSDIVEVGLTGNWGDNSAFANLYYRQVSDVINRVNTVYNDTILNRIYTNAGDARAYGLELGTTLYPTPAWRVYLSGNVYNYRIEGRLFDAPVNTATTVYSISANTDLSFTKTFSGQLGLDYLSDRVTAQGVDSRFFNPYLSLRKEFPKQRLSILFQWQNIDLGLWDANEQRITTQQSDFFTTTNYVYEVDVLRLAVSYQFTQVKRERKLLESEFGGREF
ncbi:outer membrane receptor protein involved in Fe transport [Lewinella aquimaris]|uniref:Outer membrane receptor protein involved in Fe transport n=1 Tax=Neolewinella aquimaris TaxID=1835722 RepID=A0A840EG61_9BACT|nr:TonB-dependent receptor [Neolewinella aquimaris]MBB4080898.1 outer membrane receptor protein involved in Fe transport [Neolewinella aquimaris]